MQTGEDRSRSNVSSASVYNQGHRHSQRIENKLNEHFYTSLRLLTSWNSLLSLIGTSNLLSNIDSGFLKYIIILITLCGEWKLPGLFHIFFPFKEKKIYWGIMYNKLHIPKCTIWWILPCGFTLTHHNVSYRLSTRLGLGMVIRVLRNLGKD